MESNINFDLGDGQTPNESRVIVPATEPFEAVALLTEYGYTCVIHKHELPWKDWYAILNSQGGIHMASRHSDLFQTIAEAMLIRRLQGEAQS